MGGSAVRTVCTSVRGRESSSDRRKLPALGIEVLKGLSTHSKVKTIATMSNQIHPCILVTWFWNLSKKNQLAILSVSEKLTNCADSCALPRIINFFEKLAAVSCRAIQNTEYSFSMARIQTQLKPSNNF